MKIAKLVKVSLITRVIVDVDATEAQILESAQLSFLNKIRQELNENLDEIVDDIECPCTLEEMSAKILTNNEIKILEKAENLLCCNDDDELIEMVKAIINHEDDNELVDYIDGVSVWEKIEFSFTTKQFCQEIGYTGKEFK